MSPCVIDKSCRTVSAVLRIRNCIFPPNQRKTASRIQIELRPPCNRICCGRSSTESEACSFMRHWNRPPGSQTSHNPPDWNYRNGRNVALRPIVKYDRLKRSFRELRRRDVRLSKTVHHSISQFRRNSAAVASNARPVHAPAGHVHFFTIDMIQSVMKVIFVRQIIQVIHDPVSAAETLTA